MDSGRGVLPRLPAQELGGEAPEEIAVALQAQRLMSRPRSFRVAAALS